MSYLTQEQVRTIINNAPQGTSPAGIVSSLRSKGHQLEGYEETMKSTIISEQPKEQPKSQYTVGEAGVSAVKNIIPSTGGLIKDLAVGVKDVAIHPVETVKTLGQIGAGAIQSIPGIKEVFDKTATDETGILTKLLRPGLTNKELLKENREKFNTLATYFGEKYGGWENVKRTFAEDPASVLFDASIVLSGGETALAKASELSRVAGLTKTAETLAKTAEITGKVGTSINPLVQTANIAKFTVPKVVRLAGEAVGATTGVGYGVVKQLYGAIRKGGATAEEAYKALRGNVSAEEVVSTAKNALGQMKELRRNVYLKQLENIAKDTTSLDVSSIHKELNTQLNKFGITIGEEGLDFSRSVLRFNKSAQAEIQTIFDEMKTFGKKTGDRTAIGVDNLKQAFSDLYSESSKARAFVQSMTKKTREVLGNVKGYDELVGKYEESTKLIDEIQKNLSLGNKTMIDTAYRKLSSVMRTNNELRMKFANELNELSGGKLLPQISGQQMSEVLPRGIMRPLEGVGTVGALAAGVSVLPILKALVFSSPRIMGEVIGAMGFTGQKIEQAIEIIKKVSPQVIKTILDKTKKLTPGLTIKDVSQPLQESPLIQEARKGETILQKKFNEIKAIDKKLVDSGVRKTSLTDEQLMKEAKMEVKNNSQYLAEEKKTNSVLDKDKQQALKTGTFTNSRVKEPVYHGTDRNFTEFKPAKPSGNYLSNIGSEGGYWFTDESAGAKQFGSKVVKTKINMKDPLVLKDDIYFNTQGSQRASAIQEMEAQGKDGIIFIEPATGEKWYYVPNERQTLIQSQSLQEGKKKVNGGVKIKKR